MKDTNEANNQARDVIKIVKFPNDGDNILDKDVAIIKFDKPMTINAYVTPICLPVREPAVNDECVVAGWGDVQGLYFRPFTSVIQSYIHYNRKVCMVISILKCVDRNRLVQIFQYEFINNCNVKGIYPTSIT